MPWRTPVTTTHRLALGRLACLAVLSVLANACGGDDDGSPASGGSSGSSGTGGSGAGSGGSAGSGGVPEVSNPNLPSPSYDCRDDTATENCVSVSGTYDGQPIDRHCAEANGPTSLIMDPDRWQADCGTATMGAFDAVSIPIQAPGVFHHMVLAQMSATGANVRIASDGPLTENDALSPHFLGAEIAGLVEEEASTSFDTVTGTFVAKWDPTGVSCGTCPPADIQGSFRVHYEVQFDDEP